MAKQIVAATNIDHDREKIKVGDVIDPKKFTKEQLTRLHDRGSIKIVEAHEVENKEEPKLSDITDLMDIDSDDNADESKLSVTSAPVKKAVPAAVEKK